MALPKRDWMEMTWQEIAGATTARWIAVLPLAAVEQHGPHLPLGVDSFIADAYLKRARDILPADLPVTFLPIQRIGISTEHLAFAGTLSLSASTAIAAWTELGESLARAGLRKLVLVTSHGGNVAAMELVARDLRARFGMLAVTVGWHRFGYPEGAFSAEEKKHGIHAGDIETSLMLHFRPDLVDMSKAKLFPSKAAEMEKGYKHLRPADQHGFGWIAQDINPDGAAGDASAATAEKGRLTAEHQADGFIALLRDVARFPLSELA
jgi:creatinine amidohydrolase